MVPAAVLVLAVPPRVERGGVVRLGLLDTMQALYARVDDRRRGRRTRPVPRLAPTRRSVPRPRPALDADTTADLVVVGGGFIRLWTAMLGQGARPAARWCCSRPSASAGRRPAQRRLLLAASPTARTTAASGYPTRSTRLERLGRQNLDRAEASVGRYGIDCDFGLPARWSVATQPHQVAWLRRPVQAGRGRLPRPRRGPRGGRLADVPRRAVDRDDDALVDPARLAWGLARRRRAARRARSRGPTSRTSQATARGHGRAHGVGHRSRAARRPRHQRVPLAGGAVRWHTCRSTTTR